MNIDKEMMYTLLDEVHQIDDEADMSTEYLIQHLTDTVNEFEYTEQGKDAHDIVMEYLQQC